MNVEAITSFDQSMMMMMYIHSMDFDLNLIIALDALLKHRHVTHAAQAIGLSQPAMSHALARLRAALGDPLLVRAGGIMMLTTRAEQLIPLVRDALAAAERVRAPAHIDPVTLVRSFVVGIVDYSEMVLLPVLIDVLARTAPGVTVTCRHVAGDPHHALETGVLDLWIGVGQHNHAALYTQYLISDGYLSAVRRGHPTLRGRNKKLTLKQFVALRHIQVAPAGTPGGPVDTALAQRGLSRTVAIRVPHFLVAPLLVSRCDMVLTAPALVLRALADVADLVLFAPPLSVPGFSMHQVWHERRHHDAAHRWFRGVVATMMKSNELKLGKRR
jgi:DNA-binding transcriptional LysR family regulator